MEGNVLLPQAIPLPGLVNCLSVLVIWTLNTGLCRGREEGKGNWGGGGGGGRKGEGEIRGRGRYWEGEDGERGGGKGKGVVRERGIRGKQREGRGRGERKEEGYLFDPSTYNAGQSKCTTVTSKS